MDAAVEYHHLLIGLLAEARHAIAEAVDDPKAPPAITAARSRALAERLRSAIEGLDSIVEAIDGGQERASSVATWQTLLDEWHASTVSVRSYGTD